jgi:diguanylate cyclase (GGDEF)-like protein/PAS domain S-box-containing protein
VKILILYFYFLTHLFAYSKETILEQYTIISFVIIVILTLINRKLSTTLQDKSQIDLRLIESNSSLDIALAGGEIAKWEWDIDKSKYTFDDKFYELMGYKRGSLASSLKGFVRLIHPDDKEETKHKIIEHFKNRNDFFQTAYRLRTKYGYKWVKVTGKVVSRDDIGKATKMIGVVVDIDDKKRYEEKIENISEIIDKYTLTSVVDKKGHISDISEGLCKKIGYSKDELIGKHYAILKEESIYQDEFYDFDTPKKWQGEMQSIKKNQENIDVYAYINPTFENGKLTGYVTVRDDITDKKRVESLLIVDDLTQIYNRRHFNEIIVKEIYRAKRNKQYFSLVIIDIDNFKKYNDNYGHLKGDLILKKVAGILNDSFKRASDYVFRLGGEEFAIIFTDTEPDTAYEYVKKVVAKIREFKIEHKYNIGVDDVLTISAGITTDIPRHQMNDDYFYKIADEALYKAKESGRNRVEEL